MFGYVLPEKPELKIREYELFKGYYCGVCKSIGCRYGQLPRFTLTYDSAFLALLLSSVSGEEVKNKWERCIVHPVSKRNVIKESKLIDYASDMNIILTYFKLTDNWKDERSVLSAVGMLSFTKVFQSLRGKYQKKCGIIEQRLKELHQLEKENCGSMDRASEPFARLMEEIIDCPLAGQDSKTGKVLKWIGYNIGKWLYIIDAFDDIEKDIKKKNYNPLLVQFGFKDQDIKAFKESIRQRVEFNLIYTLSEITKGYELMNLSKNKGLIENIIYMGMLRKTEQVLGISNCKHTREKGV